MPHHNVFNISNVKIIASSINVNYKHSISVSSWTTLPLQRVKKSDEKSKDTLNSISLFHCS